MSLDDIIGSIGVLLLLGAFALNLIGKLDRASRVYQGLNAVGAGIACYASWRIDYVPFVVLEAVWMSCALAALARTPAQRAAGVEH